MTAAQWEARLRAEGLAPLDRDLGDVVAVGSGRHADRPAPDYEASAEEIESRADLLHAGTRAPRRILRPYAEGIGEQQIARRRGTNQFRVRQVIAREKMRRVRRVASFTVVDFAACDTSVLLRLVGLLLCR